MNILIGWFGHETNTFSRKLSDFELLASQGYWEEDEILKVFRNTPSYLGGMIDAAEEQNIHLIPTLAVENAGPKLSDECLYYVVDKLCVYIKKNLDKLDGICLGLHGAGVSESYEDIESYTLNRIRDIVGDLPIMVTLDLHGNITSEMAEFSTGLFGIKKNPHTDYHKTGQEAMNALLKTIKGEINPHTEVLSLPLIMPMTPTEVGVYKILSDEIEAYKKDHGLLDVCFFPGFPYADIKKAGGTVFITGEGDLNHHLKVVEQMVWSKRHELVNMNEIDAVKAVKMATELIDDGLIVINESSDNPGCGAPGDATHLLRAMLEADIVNSAFGYMYDPETVEKAIRAGLHSRIDVQLGGKVEDTDICGLPIVLKDVFVKHISNGDFIATTPLMKGIAGSFGNTVTLQSGHVEIVVASVQNQTYDDRAFVVGGIDIKEKALIGLKSSQHFKAFYDTIASHIIPADSKGLATSNLLLLDYVNMPKNKYPFVSL